MPTPNPLSPAQGIKAILVAAGLADGTSGWKGRIGFFTTDDNVLACMDSPGKPSEPVVAIDYPAVQVMLRGSKAADSYATTYNLARRVLKTLHALPVVTPRTEFPELVSCLAKTGIAHLGRDDNDRPLFSLNFDLIVAPAELGNRV